MLNSILMAAILMAAFLVCTIIYVVYLCVDYFKIEMKKGRQPNFWRMLDYIQRMG